MSTINVTNLSGRGGATPNLPDGANITGVATATSFDGSLKSTGTPTLGLGVTINASGLAISGVATAGILSATTLYGDGSNLTGVGESIAPWHYNPDVNDQLVTVGTGIGITFNKKVLQGSSGTATLKMVNAGVAGTTIQSWGVSSTTYNVTQFTLDALVSPLTIDKTFQLDIPEGFIVSSTGTNYAGTAYTFATQAAQVKLWSVGNNGSGQLGQNSRINHSSPVQVTGTWSADDGHQGDGYDGVSASIFIKQDGTLWSWGYNWNGMLGTNSVSEAKISSPTQVPGTTWKTVSKSYLGAIATKTDGTLWAWGMNNHGQLGQNSVTPSVLSPIQVGSDTTWSNAHGGYLCHWATKTNGTLWAMGANTHGQLGVNLPGAAAGARSSPVQIPGTTWGILPPKISGGKGLKAIKTDGTLWSWGYNTYGGLGINDRTNRSSPTQIPGTTWVEVSSTQRYASVATKTDGTLWTWGYNDNGQLGQNNKTAYSSPVQIPGTTWSKPRMNSVSAAAIKTDGTLYIWGLSNYGQLAQNNRIYYSSPVQVPGTEWANTGTSDGGWYFLQNDETP